MPEISVTRHDEALRYEVSADGTLAGFAQFTLRTRDGRDAIVFTHTETLPDFAGQGMGLALAQQAVADAVARGLVIVPVCPFFQRYLHRNTVEGASIEWPDDGNSTDNAE